MTRNIDIEPEAAYAEATQVAANEFVATTEYAGSYEALAFKQAFTLGADTATAANDTGEVLFAVMAGRRWALRERA